MMQPDAPSYASGYVVLLPGGFVDEQGTVHAEAELSPVTGMDEELLAALQSDTPLARVVTQLLTRRLLRIGTIRNVTTDLVRELLVEDRQYLMLKLREHTFGDRIEAVFTCPSATCGKPMDVAFSLNDIQIRRAPQDRRVYSLPRGRTEDGDIGVIIEFRLATGADQEAVAEVGRTAEERAAEALLSRCILSPQSGGPNHRPSKAACDAARFQKIEEAMRGHAPHIDIEPEVACPECGYEFTAPFDIASFFLRELQPDHLRLEREVHILARYYHWSEADILSLPSQKRRRYLQLIQEEREAYTI